MCINIFILNILFCSSDADTTENTTTASAESIVTGNWLHQFIVKDCIVRNAVLLKLGSDTRVKENDRKSLFGGIYDV